MSHIIFTYIILGMERIPSPCGLKPKLRSGYLLMTITLTFTQTLGGSEFALWMSHFRN